MSTKVVKKKLTDLPVYVPTADSVGSLHYREGTTDYQVPITGLVTSNAVAQDTGGDLIKFKFYIQDSAARLRSIAAAKRDYPSVLDFDSDSVTDDSLRFTRAASKGIIGLHIPSDQEVKADIGHSLIVGDVTFSNPMYLRGVSGEGIDKIGSVIYKQLGSANAFNWAGSNTSVINGGGASRIRMFGVLASNGLYDVGNFFNVSWASHMSFKNVGFNYLNGSAMQMERMQESRIRDCFARRMGSPTSPVFYIKRYIGSYSGDNVNNFHFEGNTMGLNSGVWFYVDDNANLDTLWFQFNKLEYDSQGQYPNSAPTPVVYLGNVTRGFVNKNFLTFFNADNNNYGGGIFVVGANSGGELQITNNELYGCSGNWLDARGGRIIAFKNTSNRATQSTNMTMSNTSSRACSIEDLIQYSSNYNTVKMPVSEPEGFISAHQMFGAVNNLFVTDTGNTIYSSSNTVLTVPAATEIKRVTIPWLMSPRGFVKVHARVKIPSGTTNGSINLNIYDGTTRTNISSQTVSYSGGWALIKWQLKPTQLLGTTLIFTNDGTTQMYFDGAFILDENYYDWSFAWAPGAFTAGQVISSPTQSPLDMFGAAGYRYNNVRVQPNNDDNGLILTPRYYSTGNIIINAYNPYTTSVTPTFTRINLRISI